MAHDLFDIEKVHSNFEASLKDSADVLMDHYLDGFKELYKYIIESIDARISSISISQI